MTTSSKSHTILAPALELLTDLGHRLSLRPTHGASHTGRRQDLCVQVNDTHALVDNDQIYALIEYLVNYKDSALGDRIVEALRGDPQGCSVGARFEMNHIYALLRRVHPRESVALDDIKVVPCPDGSVWLECVEDGRGRLRYVRSENSWLPEGWSWRLIVGAFSMPDGTHVDAWEAWDDNSDRQCGYDGTDNLKSEGCDWEIREAVERANYETVQVVENAWREHKKTPVEPRDDSETEQDNEATQKAESAYAEMKMSEESEVDPACPTMDDDSDIPF